MANLTGLGLHLAMIHRVLYGIVSCSHRLIPNTCVCGSPLAEQQYDYTWVCVYVMVQVCVRIGVCVCVRVCVCRE